MQIPQEDEIWQHTYETIAYNLLFDFVPEELLYIKKTVQNKNCIFLLH
jgi:hypothetical protein